MEVEQPGGDHPQQAHRRQRPGLVRAGHAPGRGHQCEIEHEHDAQERRGVAFQHIGGMEDRHDVRIDMTIILRPLAAGSAVPRDERYDR
jgi:hypothetical protein